MKENSSQEAAPARNSAHRKNWEEQMMNDPIVEEIRRFRKEHAAQHGNDLKRIAAALRKKERASGREYLNPGPKRLEKKRESS
uniref:hypothetical protein n=1 Tax=Candidatus Electronema sp. TaxID=2698783 RepID=UPI00405679E0